MHSNGGGEPTVTRAMQDFAAAGMGVMICGFLIDVEDPSRLRRSVRLFEEEVIPKVAATPALSPVT